MPFSKELKEKIEDYCNSHLANFGWYENEFSFIQDEVLKDRLVAEFKAIRFAYKLYEGIEAQEENLRFEIRNQILAYASIYEAIIENVLETYYAQTPEFYDLMHHCIPIRISIPTEKINILQRELVHDGKDIVPFYYDIRRKEKTQVRFDDKCKTAEQLGLIHKFTNEKGEIIDLPSELIEIYTCRNGIHLIAEQRKGINYELELSKKAYRRMRPFIDQLKEKLSEDKKMT